ncbi:uncharacterized protein DNG_01692 [Cephalotrichum gorgonifer]|uniref:Adh_short domain-containing protein n=1 Tax=Cephalotrichum gorgonifer TaxID=2041049 RepID=A0AAE8SSI7_9PEZI|nr:uncharacterized protein DNG_01692 [Cephalotrichum gorgonifer]
MTTSLAKTIVATGVSSGLGLEAVRQLLTEAQPYRIILGARDVPRTKSSYDALTYDRTKHNVSILQLDLGNLREVKSFAQNVLTELGATKIDYLLLNAAITNPSEEANRFGSKWSESFIVNHLSGHYLLHLLKDKLIESQARVVVVSSGAVRIVEDPSVIEREMKAGSGAGGREVYADTKFTQLLGAHWWRRQLSGKCTVVAVSPGLIPGTGLGIGLGPALPPQAMADAKSIPEGAGNILRALTRDDFPEDPEQIFLTSWGEWWPKDVYAKSLDRDLQKKFCPGKEDIEREERID